MFFFLLLTSQSIVRDIMLRVEILKMDYGYIVNKLKLYILHLLFIYMFILISVRHDIVLY